MKISKELWGVKPDQKPETEAKKEAPVSQESPEAYRSQKEKQAISEVASFQETGNQRIEAAETRAASEGLTIDNRNKATLSGLNQNAENARQELVAEISESTPQTPPPFTPENINAPQHVIDTYFPTSPPPPQESANIPPPFPSEKRVTPPPLPEEYRTTSPPIPEEYLKVPPPPPGSENQVMPPPFPTPPPFPKEFSDVPPPPFEQNDVTPLQFQGDARKENSNNVPPISQDEVREGALLERNISAPRQISSKESSKKFLSSERKQLAEQILQERKMRRESMMRLKSNLESLNTNITSPETQWDSSVKSYGELSSFRSEQATAFADRLRRGLEGETGLAEEKENLENLLESDQYINSVKAKLAEHYSKAETLSQEYIENQKKSVEQTAIRNNCFFVHAISERSFSHKKGGTKTNLDVLLSLEPSVSASAIMQGADEQGRVSGMVNNLGGILLGGGDIKLAAEGDLATEARGIKKREVSHVSYLDKESSSQGIDRIVSNRLDSITTLSTGVRELSYSYNEIIVDNPKIAGFYQVADIDDAGRYWAGGLETNEILKEMNQLFSNPSEQASGYQRYNEKKDEFSTIVNRFKERFNLALEKGLPHYIMTFDRHLLECTGINEDGSLIIGKEVSPEEIAKGRAGLNAEQRKIIGKNILQELIFKQQELQEEAEQILDSI